MSNLHGYALAVALQIEANDIARDDRAELVRASAKEIIDLLEQNKKMARILTHCIEAMEDAMPNGLPIQQGTLNEEQAWTKTLREAKAVLV